MESTILSPPSTLPMPPNWMQSLSTALNKNAQLQYSKYFSVALYNQEKEETISDFLRCELIQDKTEAGTSYHVQPSILAFVDSRTDTGNCLLKSCEKGQHVEICWFFSLTKEKYRIKTKPKAWDAKTIETCSNQKSNFFKIWQSLNDDELITFKRAMPGEEKKRSQDELLQYEPQVESGIPLNFKLIEFLPVRVDHLLLAPPPVVAD